MSGKISFGPPFSSLLMSVVSTVATHRIGKDLMPANMNIQNAEAGYRTSLIRIRDEAESMALSGTHDAGLIEQKFEEVKTALWNAILRGETKGSEIEGKMGVKWDSRDGLDGINQQLLDAILTCSEG